MGRIARTIKWVWARAGDISQLEWLWLFVSPRQLTLSAIGAALMAIWSILKDLPAPLIALVSLGTLAILLIIIHVLRLLSQSRLTPNAQSPLRISPTLHLDHDPAAIFAGQPAFHLYSAAFCVEIENIADDSRTIHGLRAVYCDPWGARFSLAIRGSSDGRIDLHHGENAFIEVGRMLVEMEPGHVPGMSRDEGYWPISLEQANHAYNPEKTCDYFQLSTAEAGRLAHWANRPMGQIKVIITAADVQAREIELDGDLWAIQVSDRLKIRNVK